MISFLKNLISPRHPLRLAYHHARGYLAATRHGFPGKEIPVLGVTGTDGKTTTVYFLAQILTGLGLRVAYLSTTDGMIAGKIWKKKNKMTTASPGDLQRFIAAARDRKCDVVVLEVSSVALDQGRVNGIDFVVSSVTNVTREEIAYHGTFEKYRNAKMNLINRTKSAIILNADCAEMYAFARLAKKQKLLVQNFSLKTAAATYFPSKLKLDRAGSSFEIDNQKINLAVPGKYNVANFLLAFATADIFWGGQIDMREIARIAKKLRLPPGRLESIPNKRGLYIFVDYALTPHAISSVISDLKFRFPKSKISVVAGCAGGGRDRDKRPIIGAIITRLADRFYLTDDEPYREDAASIRLDILSGIKKGFSTAVNGSDKNKIKNVVFEIPDRRTAIRTAIHNAKKWDVILVTGMGHETSRNIGGREVRWSDQVEILQALKK